MLIKMTYKDKNSTPKGNEIIINNSPKHSNYYSKEEFKEFIKKMLFNELESYKSIIFQKSYILNDVWSDAYKAHIDNNNEVYRFENLTYGNDIFNYNPYFASSNQSYNKRYLINKRFFNSIKDNLTKEQPQDYIINKIVSHIYCR